MTSARAPAGARNHMGVEFKLTDRELPVSPVFVGFLEQVLSQRPAGAEIWPDQRSEALIEVDAAAHERATAAAAAVMSDNSGREYLTRAYGLLVALLAGEPAPFEALQARFHFICVTGIARTGGSYLTAEIYRALGIEPESVPPALAHDGFPEAGPFRLQDGINSWLVTLKTMAEYLTMVEVFFAGRTPHEGRIVVPKKLTQFVHAGAFFRRLLGESMEQILTLRHPVAACVSTYEKSGGLPADGRFTVRSNIEQWCRRDLEHTGCRAEQVADMDYFEAYLRYWEQYHLALALAGPAAAPQLRVVAYGRDTLRALAREYHLRFGSKLGPHEFEVSDTARRRHPEWVERSQPAIDRVAAGWKALGLEFPVAEINACW